MSTHEDAYNTAVAARDGMIENLAAHITAPVLAETIPAEFQMRGYTSPDDPQSSMAPGLEGAFIDNAGAKEYAFVVHGIIDRDYDGQFMFAQVCVRPAGAPQSFGPWHYGFYYRGGDSSWDHWTLDLVFGPRHPGYAAFGAYVDKHNPQKRQPS